MTATLVRFVRFDLRTFATTQPLRVLLPLAFVIVFTVTLPVPGIGILVGAIVAAVSASVPFQGDERGRLDTLYSIAPVRRSAVVAGRYVSMFVFALVAIGIGTATSVVVAAVRGQTVGWPLIATMLLIGFGCVCFAYALQLPWFFALGFTRGRPMIYIPVAVIAVIGFVAGQSGLLDGAGNATSIGVPAIGTAVLVLVVGVALVVASFLIAMRVYRKREL